MGLLAMLSLDVILVVMLFMTPPGMNRNSVFSLLVISVGFTAVCESFYE
jgi:hypothetical protein